MKQTDWHTKQIKDILAALSSSERGLSLKSAKEYLATNGPNKLPEGETDSLLLIFLSQFRSPLIYVLLAAALAIFTIGETVDGIIILSLLLFNSIVGTIQEGKAQNTLLALKKFVETKATVVRDSTELLIPDFEVVVGDIILLREGEKIPADARIISASNLRIDEAALTGESDPKPKTAETLTKHDLPTADQVNMVFKGTNILAGTGVAIVVATGLRTVIGKISKEISAIDTEIPLKADIKFLSRLIIFAVLIISLLLLTLGVTTGKPLEEMLTTLVSLAVSVIPEGLPIVMTLVLASGVWRMSKRNALVKKLQAVEALGQTSVIAVDKTGTITKNELVVNKVYVGGKLFEVVGTGYEPTGEVKLSGKAIKQGDFVDLENAGKAAALSADAHVFYSEQEKVWRVTGDPTEAAMIVFSEKIGIKNDELKINTKKTGEIPFDYQRKYHATSSNFKGTEFLTVAGAPEAIIKLSTTEIRGGKKHPLSVEDKRELESVFHSMSSEGLRIVALAQSSTVPNNLTPQNINSLSFVGFFGMKDALRPEVSKAVKQSNSAGIRVVMITGDHKLTAQAIASEAGIFHSGDTVITGDQINELSSEQLSEKLESISVFARVTPEHKLKIVKAYKNRGEIIAMTGDGVNDAPSLAAADLGVAMGKIGTEVAKEASDIVLLDDNFSSIVAAAEEGRSIYKTIKKVILYLFSTGLGEVLVITGAILAGYPLPLLPAQIIWLNFVTDGFLDVALAMEPKEKDLLEGTFKHPKKYLIDKLMAQRMILMAFTMAIGTLLLFSSNFESDITKAWTISLTTLAAFQWFNAWNCRHETKSIFRMNLLANKFLVGATFIVVGLQILVVYSPFMQKLFHTTALEFSDWLLIIPVAATIIVVEEIRKFIARRRI